MLILPQSLPPEKENIRCLRSADSVWLKYAITRTELIKEYFDRFAESEFGGIHSVLPTEPMVTAKAMLLLDQLRERKDGMSFAVLRFQTVGCYLDSLPSSVRVAKSCRPSSKPEIYAITRPHFNTILNY